MEYPFIVRVRAYDQKTVSKQNSNLVAQESGEAPVNGRKNSIRPCFWKSQIIYAETIRTAAHKAAKDYFEDVEYYSTVLFEDNETSEIKMRFWDVENPKENPEEFCFIDVIVR